MEKFLDSGWTRGYRSTENRLMMINLRPYKYSWKRSIPKTIERESLFQFGHIVSRNHVKRGTNILFDVIVGFLRSHGIVRGVPLLLQNLYLFLILLVSLDRKFLEWELM